MKPKYNYSPQIVNMDHKEIEKRLKAIEDAVDEIRMMLGEDGEIPQVTDSTRSGGEPVKEQEDSGSTTEGSDKPGNGNIYVFLVGIDEYITASKLNFCVSDIDKVEQYLIARYQLSEPITQGDPNYKVFNLPTGLQQSLAIDQVHIYRLEDNNATYEKIKESFQTFFKDVSKNDKMWFHYSGHGTEALSAEAFASLENGKDQCLVCHDYKVLDDGTAANLLADKEIAQLLNQVATEEKGIPHILLTVDACHSGSISREGIFSPVEQDEQQVTTRSLDLPSHNRRDINTYFGYSEDHSDYVAPPAHVNISACSNLQLAGESSLVSGGYFTEGLIQALPLIGEDLSYADLLYRARHFVRKKRKNQDPQFFVAGGFNAYSSFLDGSKVDQPLRYEVRFEEGSWALNCGIIHNLPANPPFPIEVDIYPIDQSGPDDKRLFTAKIQRVGPQFSPLDLTNEQKEILNRLNNLNKVLIGVPKHIPAEPVYISFVTVGESASLDKLNEAWNSNLKIETLNIKKVEDGPEGVEASVIIEAHADKYVLKDVNFTIDDAKLHALLESYKPGQHEEKLVDDIIGIANWRRTRALVQDRSKLLDKVSFELSVEGNNGLLTSTNSSSNLLEFEVSEANAQMDQSTEPGELPYGLNLKVSIDGLEENVFTYLFFMYSDMEIASPDGEKPYEVNTKELTYDAANVWGLSAGSNEGLLILKLLVSMQPIDHFQLLQSGIGGTRIFKARRSEKTLDDWCTITKEIRLKRKQ